MAVVVDEGEVVWDPELEQSFLNSASFFETHPKGPALATAATRRAEAALAKSDAHLDECDLRGACISDKDFSGRSLKKAFLHRAKAKGARFKNINGEGACFNHVHLGFSDNNKAGGNTFRGSQCRNASFRKAIIDATAFQSCDLRETTWEDAKLTRWVNFGKSQLAGANFDGATLNPEVNLDGATCSPLKPSAKRAPKLQREGLAKALCCGVASAAVQDVGADEGDEGDGDEEDDAEGDCVANNVAAVETLSDDLENILAPVVDALAAAKDVSTQLLGEKATEKLGALIEGVGEMAAEEAKRMLFEKKPDIVIYVEQMMTKQLDALLGPLAPVAPAPAQLSRRPSSARVAPTSSPLTILCSEARHQIPQTAAQLTESAIEVLLSGEVSVSREWHTMLDKFLSHRTAAKVKELVRLACAEQMSSTLRSATDKKSLNAAMSTLKLHSQAIEKVIGRSNGTEQATSLFSRELERMRTRVLNRRLTDTTVFFARGLCDMVHKVVTIPKFELKKVENDIIYLQERLAKAEEPILKTSWQDSVESWIALADLLPVIRAERGVAVLECIFADEEVTKACGWGKLFINTNGEAPDDLIKFLKQGLGKHIKANGYRYRQTLDGELASIRRIYELKERTFQTLWAVFAAALVGLFSFVSTMLWSIHGESITLALAT